MFHAAYLDPTRLHGFGDEDGYRFWHSKWLSTESVRMHLSLLPERHQPGMDPVTQLSRSLSKVSAARCLWYHRDLQGPLCLFLGKTIASIRASAANTLSFMRAAYWQS